MKAKMKYKLLKCMLVFGVCSTQQALAQDTHFSQFYETSILRNPSLTGIYNGDYRFGVMYRNQWSSISAPFQTAVAWAELKKQVGETDDFMGFGVLGFFDRTGSINLTSVSGCASFSYNKNINRDRSTFLSFGAMAGYLQRSYDPGKMTLGNQFIPGIGFLPSNPSGETFTGNKTNRMNIGVGINYTSNTADENTNYSVGLAAYHLTRPESNFYSGGDASTENIRWNAHANFNRIIDEVWSSQLQANVMLQGGHREIIVGGLVGRKSQEGEYSNTVILYGGLMYRVQDAFIPIVKLDYNDFTIGVSYDLNVSKLRAASNIRGGFEISMIKTGLLSDPQRGFNKTVCPRR